MRKIIGVLILFFALCETNNAIGQTHISRLHGGITGVPALIYKTKKDYRHLVPVILSEDKTKIASYPDPSDLKINGAYTLPTILHKGYLLDNKGINQNVAFLKWTYEEYAALKQPPSLDEIYHNIIDKDPLTKLYNCGLKHDKKNTLKYFNNLIDKKQLSNNCKAMK